MRALPGSYALPAAVVSRHSGWRTAVAYQYAAPAVTYRLESPSGAVRFAKLGATGAYPGLPAEIDRLRWAQGRLSVPRLIDSGREGEVDWLLTEGLAGTDATDERWTSDPERLVGVLAGVLRELHEQPPGDCPFDFRLDRALAHARRRVEAGLVDVERDFHEEFGSLTPATALARLVAERPDVEDLVVCHGDFCLPNVMVEEWSASGILDLGELGVADRWWDLAVATWSLTWNLGPGFEDRFLQAYGAERDESRESYFRLLYDMVS